jgi:competence protein ComEA
VTAADRSDRPGPREGASGLLDERPPAAGPVERAAAWLQATPAELLGVAVLLLGALAASLLLWSGAAARPSHRPASEAAGHVGGASQPEHVGQPVTTDAVGDGEPGGDGAPGGVGGPGEDAGPGGLGGSGGVGRSGGVGTTAEPPAPAAGVGLLTVHVSGAVVQPGLVTVPAGARVGDAVAAAGGFTGRAEPAAVNLARQLTDGEQVHVPVEGEGRMPGSAAGSPAAELDPDGASAGTAAIDADGRVDLNRASEQELQTLPGVGPARAAAIIEHRESHGPFSAPGDLRAVPGIGEKTFQTLADRVVVR